MAASLFLPKLPASWTEESLTTANGAVSLRVFRSADLSRGRFLFLVHGQGEQSDRYEHFPHYLQGLIDAVIAIDLPGHGRSQGRRGHIENFDQYENAVLEGFQAAQNWMLSKASRCEAHWLGHSLGGLITLRTLLKNPNLPLRSVTASAPLLGLALKVPVLKKFFAELIEPLWGSLQLHNELNTSIISHDPEVGKAYEGNPLNHHLVTPRFFVNLLKEMDAVSTTKETFHYPLMLLIPLEDQTVSWKASYEFFSHVQMASGKKKTLTSFPNYYHEAFNELGKELPFNALSDWIALNS